jgi:hypothetical protein
MFHKSSQFGQPAVECCVEAENGVAKMVAL